MTKIVDWHRPWKHKDFEIFDAITEYPIDNDITKDLLRRLRGELLLKDMVIGEIRWPKTWTTLPLADRGVKFSLLLSFITEKFDYSTNSWVKILTTIVPFKMKNGPDDDRYYRVSFMATRIDPRTEYTLDILTLDQQLWPEPSDETRLVYPSSRVFISSKNGQILDPFDMTTLRHIPSSHVPKERRL